MAIDHTAAHEQPPPTRKWWSHVARFSVEVPADWRLLPAGMPPALELIWGDAVGAPAGFVAGVALAGAELTLAAATREIATLACFGPASSVQPVTHAGQPAMLVTPGETGLDPAPVARSVPPGMPVGGGEQPLRALVLPHPAPFAGLEGPVAFVALLGDAARFAAISATLRFDADTLPPAAYLDHVIDLMAVNAYRRTAVDWPAVRAAAHTLTAAATTTAATEPGLDHARTALRTAGDHHSFFVPAAQAATYQAGVWRSIGIAVAGQTVMLVYPDSPAAAAGLVVGDEVIALDGRALTAADDLGRLLWRDDARRSLTVRPAAGGPPRTLVLEQALVAMNLPPRAAAITPEIGYVELFATGGDWARHVAYATAGHDALRAVTRETTPAGWIVDLRRNLGGSYLSMVAAVGPILGNGPFWGNIDSYGVQTRISYANGEFWQDGLKVSDSLATAAPYQPARTDLPVAVLIGAQTVSSGEVVALAFVGRPRTRFFGTTTTGRTTSNSPMALADGAVLNLETTVMTDRTGRPYPAGLTPDAPAATDWAQFGTLADPAVQAAVAWLERTIAR